MCVIKRNVEDEDIRVNESKFMELQTEKERETDRVVQQACKWLHAE